MAVTCFTRPQKHRRLTPCSSLWIAILVWVSACASASHRAVLPEGTPERFSASGQAPLDVRWWLRFEDEHLNALMDRALVNNPGLLATRQRLAQARAVARKDGADQFPSVDMRGGFDRTTRRDPGLTATTKTWSAGVEAGYEIDLWGRARSDAQAANLDVRASESDLQTAAITLSANVGNTWYRLAEQHRQVALLANQLAINEQIRELVSLRFKRGLVRAADVLRQRQFAESTRGQMALARSRRAVLEHQLAILLGLPPLSAVADSTADLVSVPPLPDVGLPADLILRRPDIKKAFFNVMAADKRVASAIAERFPRLSLSGQATSSANSPGGLFEAWLFRLSGNLIGPLIDGGRRKAEVTRTKAVVAEGVQVYGQVVLGALAEVEDALVQETEQAVYLESLARQLVLSEQVILRVRDSYTSGGADYLRVLDALQTHQQLERTYLIAKRERIEYRIALCRTLGGGWDLATQEHVTK
jgi:NodT family efflux transporter outer membrane factor (OMF) lipoprotein